MAWLKRGPLQSPCGPCEEMVKVGAADSRWQLRTSSAWGLGLSSLSTHPVPSSSNQAQGQAGGEPGPFQGIVSVGADSRQGPSCIPWQNPLGCNMSRAGALGQRAKSRMVGDSPWDFGQSSAMGLPGTWCLSSA